MPLAPPVTTTRLPRSPRTELLPPLVNQAGDKPGPAGLMRSAEARASIAVEIFVEEDQIFPMRVALELLDAFVNRARTSGAASEDPNQAVGDFAGHLGQSVIPSID